MNQQNQTPQDAHSLGANNHPPVRSPTEPTPPEHNPAEGNPAEGNPTDSPQEVPRDEGLMDASRKNNQPCSTVNTNETKSDGACGSDKSGAEYGGV